MCQVSYRCTKKNKLTLSNQNHLQQRTKFRNNQTTQLEKNGAIQFWWIKFHLRNEFSQIQHWSGSLFDSRRKCKKKMSVRYIYHMGCAFNLHSTIKNVLIPRNQDSSKRQIIRFLSIGPIDKDHEDLKHNYFSVKRRAQHLYSAWRKHQNGKFWVDIDIAIKMGLTHFQTRLDAIIFQKKTNLFNSKKLWDWKQEMSCVRNHTCLLDSSRKSYCDTITIGSGKKW